MVWADEKGRRCAKVTTGPLHLVLKSLSLMRGVRVGREVQCKKRTQIVLKEVTFPMPISRTRQTNKCASLSKSVHRHQCHVHIM